jgi:hypothetical protein
MRRIPVVSSNLAAVGYNAETEILEIQFRNNRIYQYANVPETIHSGLMSAGSKGIYFNLYIKNAGFAYKRVA